jgi:hypothetical protein
LERNHYSIIADAIAIDVRQSSQQRLVPFVSCLRLLLFVALQRDVRKGMSGLLADAAPSRGLTDGVEKGLVIFGEQ